MADELMDQMYKALRLLPEFDGNSNMLTRFLKLCDKLVEQFYKNEPEYDLSNMFLINGILNKITGSAARTLNCNSVPDTWDGIRKALIDNFTNQRDEATFYNDLTLLAQGSKNPQEFYEHCQNLFSDIMTFISLNETVASTIESKCLLYKKLILQSFLRGLNDPLGFRIRCMRPESIEQALEFVIDEMNTLNIQQRNQYLGERRFNNLPFVGMPFASAQSAGKPFGYTPQTTVNMTDTVSQPFSCATFGSTSAPPRSLFGSTSAAPTSLFGSTNAAPTMVKPASFGLAPNSGSAIPIVAGSSSDKPKNVFKTSDNHV